MHLHDQKNEVILGEHLRIYNATRHGLFIMRKMQAVKRKEQNDIETMMVHIPNVMVWISRTNLLNNLLIGRKEIREQPRN